MKRLLLLAAACCLLGACPPAAQAQDTSTTTTVTTSTVTVQAPQTIYTTAAPVMGTVSMISPGSVILVNNQGFLNVPCNGVTFTAQDGMVIPTEALAPGMIVSCTLPAGLTLNYTNPYAATMNPYGTTASFLQANGYAAPQYPYGYGNMNPYGLGSTGFPYGGGQTDWNNTWPNAPQPAPGFFY